MSEDSEVLKIYNALVDKHNFSAELLKFKPNTKDSKAISNQSIRQILSKASKAKTGELGKLDIYYCSEEEKFLFLVEVKEKTSQQKKAIEDIQHYLSFFEELSIDYKVVGLAISGNISEEDNFKIATFTIKEKKITLVKRLENFLASKEKYLDLFVVKKNNVDKETDENKIISLARDTSRLLRELGGNDKPMVVAGALITLCKPIKKEKYIRSKIRGIISKYKETLQKGEELLENEEIEIIGQEIKSNFLKEGKADKEEEHSDLIRVLKESLSDAQRDKKVKTVNDSIVWVINKVENSAALVKVFVKVYQALEIISLQGYDLAAKFYQAFLEHWRGDGDRGIVLTPCHITELMVELIDKFKANFEEGKRGIVEKDICLDPCAGTGGFLLAFMKHQIREYNNKEEAKENLIGIERHPGMFVLSVANMLIQGDGKANLEQGNCLVKQEISKKPSIGLMNPPYSDPKQPEIKFAEQLLKFVKNGWAAMIVPTSTFTNKSELNKDIKEKIYKQNTLKAVIQMPSQLFYPLSVPTQIVIFQTESSHQQGDKVYFYNLVSDGHKLVKKIRKDKNKKWIEIKNDLWKDLKYLKGLKDDEENEKAKYSLVVTDVSVKDDWSFHYQQKKQIEKDFTELFIVNPSKGKILFEKVISEFLLYKIEEKAGVLDRKLRINYEEEKGNTKEKEKLKKEQPNEWTVIYNYLLHKWKNKKNNLELKASDKIGENLKFLKQLVWKDLVVKTEIPHRIKEILEKKEQVKQIAAQLEMIKEKDKFYSELSKKLERLKNEVNQWSDLDKKKWWPFQVGRIFNVQKSKKEDCLKMGEVKWGDNNYITTASKNNGIHFRSATKTYLGNMLTVATNGDCLNFYQDKPFCVNSDVAILKLKEDYSSLNIYRGLFLNSLLRVSQKYHGWTNKRGKEELEKELIILPVKENRKYYKECIESSDYELRADREEVVKEVLPKGKILIQYAEYEPDWEFMDVYIFIISERLIEEARI